MNAQQINLVFVYIINEIVHILSLNIQTVFLHNRKIGGIVEVSCVNSWRYSNKIS